MGCYINPRNMTKEHFLGQFEMISGPTDVWTGCIPTFEEFSKKGAVPVVLIDNGMFTAAGVAFNEDEYDVFTRKGDVREREVYSVPVKDLNEVSDIKNFKNFLPEHLKTQVEE